MTLRTPTNKADTVLADEPLGAPDDDADPIVDAAPEGDELSGAPAEAPEKPAKPSLRGEHPTRLAIIERYKEMQRAERGETEEGEPEPVVIEPEPEGEVDPPPAKEAKAKSDKKAPSPGPSLSEEDDPELELIIFGERTKARRSDLIKEYDIHGAKDDVIVRIAQRDRAAQRRLADANRAFESAKAQGQEKPDDTSGDTDRQAAPQVLPDRSVTLSPDQDLDDEKLAEIAERIQVGDSEEGKEALREVLQLAAKRNAIDPAQIRAIVAADRTQENHQAEITKAITKFGKDNPDLVEDPDLQEVAISVVAREMREDMKKVGITDDQLNALGNNRQALAMAHRDLRMKGHAIPDYEDVLGRTAGYMRSRFNIPAPVSKSPDGSPPKAPGVPKDQVRERISRKELAQPQPRHGGARAGAPQEPKPKSPQDHINEMRRMRGFRTLSA